MLDSELVMVSELNSSSARENDGVAADLDLGDLVLRTLGHAGGEEHVALVGADRDLGRIDAEVDIAAVQVPGVELLQVAGQLFLGVLVVTAVPRRPVVLPGLPGLQDVLALELLGTDQVDVTDLGRLAFLDGDRDVHAVAVQRAHGRGDLDGVLATVVVLATQFLGHAVQAQAVEGAAFAC
ncbi:hypothetical protein G6F63_014061 [Rhizopus arrhizus]|nr:hypothetical protein G6F63_014061 [Rhizopus arrhizus]